MFVSVAQNLVTPDPLCAYLLYCFGFGIAATGLSAFQILSETSFAVFRDFNSWLSSGTVIVSPPFILYVSILSFLNSFVDEIGGHSHHFSNECFFLYKIARNVKPPLESPRCLDPAFCRLFVPSCSGEPVSQKAYLSAPQKRGNA